MNNQLLTKDRIRIYVEIQHAHNRDKDELFIAVDLFGYKVQEGNDYASKSVDSWNSTL